MRFIKPTWPAPENIHACTTTRHGGYSTSPYEQFNLGDHVGEDANIVEKNRNLLKEQLNLPADPIWLSQVHGTNVLSLDQTTTPGQEADASITQQTGVVCTVLTADCLPLLICNEAGTHIAAIHAGWRGLAAGVIQTTIQKLNQPTDSLLVWMGPAIGPNAFEIGEDTRASLLAACPQGTSAFKEGATEDKWLCNLYRLAELTLNNIGVTKIFGGEYCTYTQNNLFYSYRKKNPTGRMATLIWMT